MSINGFAPDTGYQYMDLLTTYSSPLIKKGDLDIEATEITKVQYLFKFCIEQIDKIKGIGNILAIGYGIKSRNSLLAVAGIGNIATTHFISKKHENEIKNLEIRIKNLSDTAANKDSLLESLQQEKNNWCQLMNCIRSTINKETGRSTTEDLDEDKTDQVLKEIFANARAINSDLEGKLSESKNRIALLEKSNQDLSKEHAEFKQEIDEARRNIKDILPDFQKAFPDLQIEQSTLGQTLSIILIQQQKALNNLQGKIKHLTKVNNGSENQIADLKQSNQNLNKDLETLKNDKSQLEEKLDDYREKSEMQISCLEEKNSSLTEQLKTLNTDNTSLKEKMEKLEKRLDQADQNNNNANNASLEEMQRAIKDLQRKAAQTTELNDKLNSEISDLNEQNGELKRTNQLLAEQNEILKIAGGWIEDNQIAPRQ